MSDSMKAPTTRPTPVTRMTPRLAVPPFNPNGGGTVNKVLSHDGGESGRENGDK